MNKTQEEAEETEEEGEVLDKEAGKEKDLRATIKTI